MRPASPKFVVYDETGPDALHYPHMVAILVAAIKDLKSLNDGLAARVAALEAK